MFININFKQSKYKCLIMAIRKYGQDHQQQLYKRPINKIIEKLRQSNLLSQNQQSSQICFQEIEKLETEYKQYATKVLKNKNHNPPSIASDESNGIFFAQKQDGEQEDQEDISEINFQQIYPSSLEQFSFIIKGRSFANVRQANRIIGFSSPSLINQYIAKAACALLNEQGGYILLAEQYFPEQQKITKGIKLNQYNLQLWQQNIRIIKTRLEPQDNVNIDMSFLPLKQHKGDPQQKPIQYVIRLIVIPKDISKVCYYKEGKDGTINTFFQLCHKDYKLNQPKPIKSKDVYEYIVNRNKQKYSNFLLQEPINTAYEVFSEVAIQSPNLENQKPTLSSQLVQQFHKYKQEIDQKTNEKIWILKIKKNEQCQQNWDLIKSTILEKKADTRFFQLPPKLKCYCQAHQHWKKNYDYLIVKSNLQDKQKQDIRGLQTINAGENKDMFVQLQTKIQFGKCMHSQNYQLLKQFIKILDKEPYFFQGKLKDKILYSGFKIYCYNNQKPLPPSHIIYLYFYTLALDQRPVLKGYNQ